MGLLLSKAEEHLDELRTGDVSVSHVPPSALCC